MINFNRKTEYALIAMEHMLRKDLHEDSSLTSTREVSNAYQIPYAFLAKVLQELASKGFIKAVQGTKGGYVFNRHPEDISIADLVEIFEGPVAVADCFKEEKITCPQWNGCLIRNPLYELNHKIFQLLAETSVADLAGKNLKHQSAIKYDNRALGIRHTVPLPQN